MNRIDRMAGSGEFQVACFYPSDPVILSKLSVLCASAVNYLPFVMVERGTSSLQATVIFAEAAEVDAQDIPTRSASHLPSGMVMLKVLPPVPGATSTRPEPVPHHPRNLGFHFSSWRTCSW
jgi:hypothetical protein